MYRILMLALCVIAILVLVILHAFRIDPDIVTLVAHADLVACIAFALAWFLIPENKVIEGTAARR
jgi:hypothetical protein